MKKTVFASMIAAAALVSMGDVTVTNTSSVAEIQAAIDAAESGDVITLADGTYTFDQPLTVTKDITLTGSHRDKCILAGSGSLAAIAAVTIDNANACVMNLTVTNVVNPSASDYGYHGVGVWIKSGLLTQARVTGCRTTAGNRVGGVSLESDSAVMTHCVIDHNGVSGGNGIGGVRLHKNGGKMVNCLIWANSGGSGDYGAGGVSVKPDPWKSVKIVNCTIAGNTATKNGGGLKLEVDYFESADPYSGGPWIVNTIIANNTAPSGADIFFNKDDTKKYTGYNCLCPTLTGDDAYGANPQTGNPLFVNPGAGDFHLQPGSPARNNGDAAKGGFVLGLEFESLLDLDGNRRVVDGEVDIGCYEFDPYVLSCSITMDEETIFLGDSVTLTAAASGFGSATDVAYSWQVQREGAAEPITGAGAQFTLAPNACGTYTVNLTASSASAGKSVDAEPTTFFVAPRTIYMTMEENPNATYPYVTPETATSDFDEAMGAAIAGTTILLEEGVYQIAEPLAINKAITLQGATNGATVLMGAYDRKNNDVSQLTVSGGATLDHLTITGGKCTGLWAAPGEGVTITSGTLSWCVISNNVYSGSGNSYAVGVYANVSSGEKVTITHCQICDNTSSADYNSTKGIGLYVCGGGTFLMDNCLVARNSSVKGNVGTANLSGGGLWISHSNATIVNCTFADNHHGNRGGGVYIDGGSPKFYNCIIARNSADNDPCAQGPDISATTLADGGIPASITGLCSNNLVSFGVTPFGVNGISADPGFADDSYRLHPASRARNAGDKEVAASVLGYGLEGTLDFYGLERVLEDQVEIGCAEFEFDPSQLTCSIEQDKVMVFPNEPITLTARSAGFETADDVVYSWWIMREGDAEPLVTNGVEIVLSPVETGAYTVDLTVSSTKIGKSATALPVSFLVMSKTVYVTSRANPGSAYPYGTPETAATSLAEALSAAIEGATVVLDDGTHQVSATVVVPAGVTISGAGRDKTTIYATASFDPVVRINGRDALLQGVTIAHGRMSTWWSTYAVGVVIGNSGGTLADCRVTDCSAATAQRVFGVVSMSSSDALVTRCLIDGNSVTTAQSVCGGIYATAGRIESCVITNNESSASAYLRNHKGAGLCLDGAVTVLNCTVLDNRMASGNDGAGVHAESSSARVHNCIIDGNVNGDGSEANYLGNAASFSYCLSSEEAPEGSEACIVGRPVFSATKPYYLDKLSPGRSQGSVAGYEDRLMKATDCFGQPRVKHISSRGVADIDIGATESTYPSGTILLMK